MRPWLVSRTNTSLVRSSLPLPHAPLTGVAARDSANRSGPTAGLPPARPPTGVCSTATVSQPCPVTVVSAPVAAPLPAAAPPPAYPAPPPPFATPAHRAPLRT